MIKIYVHGNCQAPALAVCLKELSEAWVVDSTEVHLQDLDNIDGYCSLIEQADIIISQPISIGYRQSDLLSIDYIRNSAKPSAKIVTFPSIFFRGYTPEACYLHSLPHFGLPYWDANVIDFYLRGFSSEDTYTAINSHDFCTPSFIFDEMQISLSELRDRESQTHVDICASDLIENDLLDLVTFHTINHPTRHIIHQVANRVLKLLNFSSRVSAQGQDYISFIRMPPYRSVQAAMRVGANSRDANDVLISDGPITRKELIDQQFRHIEANIGRDLLTTSFRSNSKAMEYVQRRSARTDNQLAGAT